MYFHNYYFEVGMGRDVCLAPPPFCNQLAGTRDLASVSAFRFSFPVSCFSMRYVPRPMQRVLMINQMMAGLLQLVLLAVGTFLCMQLAHAGDVILKPPQGEKKAVALILIPSLEVDPLQYKSLATFIQDACDCSLWVGVPQFPLNVVLYNEMGNSISRVLEAM